MLRKFAEAIRLYGTNFVVITLIVLTVWLPGNLLGEYLIWYVPSDDEVMRSFRLGSLIEAVSSGRFTVGRWFTRSRSSKRAGGRATSRPSPSASAAGDGSFPRGSSPASISCWGSSCWWFRESYSWFATCLSMPSSCSKE